MARISVEQKALSDARYAILGTLLGSTRQHALGCMVEVWNECQERETFTLSDRVLAAILGTDQAAEFLVLAELGSRNYPGGGKRVHPGLTRIKGAQGRIEWLGKARENGRRGGKKGGRPKNPPANTNGLPSGYSEKTPPAPAPAPAPALLQEQEPELSPAIASDPPARARVPRKPRNGKAGPSTALVTPAQLQELQDQFEKLYEFYPRHTHRDEAWRAFVKLHPDLDLLREIASNIRVRVNSGGWLPSDPERLRFIPHLATYLNQRRWLDEDVT